MISKTQRLVRVRKPRLQRTQRKFLKTQHPSVLRGAIEFTPLNPKEPKLKATPDKSVAFLNTFLAFERYYTALL